MTFRENTVSDLDRLGRQLQQDVPRRQWPETDLLQATLARRASRRLAVSSGLVILVVLAGVTTVIGIGTRPSAPANPTPTAPAPSQPAPTAPEPSPSVTGPPASGDVFARQISFVSAN